jgi:O-acetyl-ADP-ribose deacetylase (regulator of RNase III)
MSMMVNASAECYNRAKKCMRKIVKERLIAEHSLPGGQMLRLLHGDLTTQRVDAIVNAANAYLMHGGGVAGAIVRAGGEQIQRESDAWVRKHGLVSHAHPAITGAGRLPCRYVLHAVGPRWGEGEEEAKLSAAVRGALALAEEHDLATLAMPAIAMGIFGFPAERGAEVMLDAVEQYFAESAGGTLREVRFLLIDRATPDSFRMQFERRWPGSVAQA